MATMEISAKDVFKLRKQTGAGMMDCKKALIEAEGDFEKATDVLRKTGQKLANKRADRDATEGYVLGFTNGDDASIVVLNCETDFVAKNDDFIALTHKIAELALSKFPQSKEELLDCDFGGISIRDKVTEQVGVIGEKIELANYERLEADMVVPYIHMGNKAGVIVGVNKNSDSIEDAAKNVAMQVAAMKPLALNEAGIDSSIVEKEIEIGKEVARQEGKPEAMLERIAEGKLKKFFKENTLLNQAYVKDNKMSIAAYLESVEKGLTVTDFKHVMLG